MSFKVLEDNPDHYKIQGPDGMPFKMAKKGLTPEIHAKVLAYKSPIKMSDGGPVPGDDLQGGSSNLPPDQSTQDPTAGLPQMSPEQAAAQDNKDSIDKAIQDRKDFLLQSSPNVYNQYPDLLERHAQDQILAETQTKFNRQNASAIDAKNAADKKLADDTAYNEGASKLGLPLRQISQPTGSTAEGSGIKNASYDLGAPDPSQGQNPMQAQISGINNQESALGKLNSDLDAANSMSQNASTNMIQGLHELDKNNASIMQNLQAQGAKESDAFMTGKVDPNRVWNNMGTGNKILSAVALALGGIGSGLTGKPNAALEVINNAIDKDVDSQKIDMEKNRQGFMMNQQAQRDQMGDYSLKKASLISAAQAQIGMATAKSQNAQTKLQGAMMVQSLENQKQQIYSDIAKQKSVQRLVEQNPSNPEVLSGAIRMVVPEKQQEQAFKELDRVTTAIKARDTINQFFGSSNDKNTIMGRLVHGGFAPADLDALNVNLMPVLKDLEGRINPQEIEALHGLLPQVGDSSSKVKTKLDGLNKFIDSKSQSSMLSSYGLMPKNAGVYNEKGQKRFNEGRPN